MYKKYLNVGGWNTKTLCYFCQSQDALTLAGMAHKPWFYWINDGNPHLHSPSLKNSMRVAYTARPGPLIQQKKKSDLNLSSLYHHNKLKPVSLTRIPRVNKCVWGGGGLKTRTDPQGWWLWGWKMNEKPVFPYAIQTAGSIDPPKPSSPGSQWEVALKKKKKKSANFQPLSSDLSPPSVGICNWKKIPDLCHAREWVSSWDDLGWSGEGEYV